MGCGASVQTNSLKKNGGKKMGNSRIQDKDPKKSNQVGNNQNNNSKKSNQQNKNIKSSGNLSKSKTKVIIKANPSEHSSSKSLPKEQRTKSILKTTGQSLRSSQKDILPVKSHAKFEVEQINQNQQDIDNYASQKKIKKMKKKKTGLDPKLGELMKVYGLQY